LVTAVFGTLSALIWGAGDFLGGFASRSTPTRMVVLFSQLSGVLGLMALVWVFQDRGLSTSDLIWSALAGIGGMVGLFALYHAMAIGQMGIASPIAGVLSTLIPVLFGALTQGFPGWLKLMGFGLTLVAIYFITRSSGEAGQASAAPAGFWLAVFSGLGFSAFFIAISNVEGGVFTRLVVARSASFVVLGALSLVTRQLRTPSPKALPMIALCGLADAGGNALFVLAEQAGRLDVATALSSLYPASTLFLAIVFLKERMNRWQALGVALILVAIPMIASDVDVEQLWNFF
jgi:drug/metabolite transporter (DMT)-like permease